jgi:hypothetical protein
MNRTAELSTQPSARPGHRADTRRGSVAVQVGGVATFARRLLSPTVLLTVVAPFLAYDVLTSRGNSQFTALLVSSAFPLIDIAVTAVRHRRLERLGVFSLVTTLLAIALGVLGSLVFGDSRFLLIKDPILNAAIGLIFLLSLAAPRPVAFVVGRQLTARTAAQRGAYDDRWSDPRVRRSTRLMTAAWGAALVGEASIRIGLSFVLSPATLLLVSPLMAAAVFGPMAAWSLRRYKLRRQAIAEIA